MWGLLLDYCIVAVCCLIWSFGWLMLMGLGFEGLRIF